MFLPLLPKGESAALEVSMISSNLYEHTLTDLFSCLLQKGLRGAPRSVQDNNHFYIFLAYLLRGHLLLDVYFDQQTHHVHVTFTASPKLTPEVHRI